MGSSAAPSLGQLLSNSPDEYIPAPHLVASSFMSYDDLVFYYKGLVFSSDHLPSSAYSYLDFHSSLKYVATAPELVYERLISNIGIALESRGNREGQTKETTTACRRDEKDDQVISEHDSIALQTTKTKQRCAIPSLEPDQGNTKHSVEREIETPSSIVAADPISNAGEPTLQKLRPESTTASQDLKGSSINLPLIGTFRFDEGEVSQKLPYAYNHLNFYPRSEAPENVLTPTGLTSMRLINNTEYSLGAWASFSKACMKSLYGDYSDIACSWLEIDRRQSEILSGDVDVEADSTPKRILFGDPYNVPPRVIVWLNSLDMKPVKSFHLIAYPSNVTATGFTLNTEHHCNTISVSWIACAENMEGVCSGTIIASSAYHPKRQGRADFSPGTFKTPPRVIIAISQIQIDTKSSDLVLGVSTSEITATGMTWNLSGIPWRSRYQIEASYIALRY